MKPTAPPVKRGKPGQRDRPIAAHDFFNDRQAVPHAAGGRRAVNLWTTRPFSITIDLAAGLPDDGAGIAADKRVAADMLAALDGFEEEGLALAADFVIGREGRFQIGQNAARDRDEVSLAGQFQEFVPGSDNDISCVVELLYSTAQAPQ